MNMFIIIFDRKYDTSINIFLHLSIGQVVQVVTIEADEAEGMLHLSEILSDLIFVEKLEFHLFHVIANWLQQLLHLGNCK